MTGEIGADDLVWKEGLADWIPANQVKKLLAKGSATVRSAKGPPPLPLAIDEPIAKKNSKWQTVCGVLLVLAGCGALSDAKYGVAFVWAALLLILAGSMLLPVVWNAVVRRWPSLESHSTLISALLCIIAFAVLGGVGPRPQITRVPQQLDDGSFEFTTNQQKLADEIDTGRTKPFSNQGHDVVTKAQFARIQNGMSYNEVVAVIGVVGEEQASNHIDGVPGVIESINTVMYLWQNRDGTNMNVMLQNDRVVSKAQFGLH